MAKQPQKKDERELTRKETVRRRRDVEATRRVVIGLVAVAALVIVLIAAGLVQELVLKPRQPVATVNGSSIALQDYQKLVKFAWLQQGNQVQDPQGSAAQTLDDMIDQDIIRQQAAAKGITVTQDDVTTAIQQSFGYYATPPTATPTDAASPTPTETPVPTATPQPNATAGPTGTPVLTATPVPTATPVTLQSYQTSYNNFLQTLQKQTGMTEADYRNLVQVDLMRQKLYDVVTKDVPTTGEAVHARHILVAIITPAPTAVPTIAVPTPMGPLTPTITPAVAAGSTAAPATTATPTAAPSPTPSPTPVPRTDAEALARAQEVEGKLKAGGDWNVLAKEYSDDPGSANKGGDLGWLTKDQVVPEFATAAFSLTLNTISDPVKSQFGYHVIEVLEKDPKHPLDPYTLQTNQSQAFQTWLTDQRNAAKITRNWTPDDVPPTPVTAGQ